MNVERQQISLLEQKIRQLRLNTLRMITESGSGHPDMNKTLGVDMTTNSLGNGLSAGIGMALACKLDKCICNAGVR